jgi:hypothetical protein
MFKQWKKNRENKNDILLYQTYLFKTLAEFVYDIKEKQELVKQSGITDEEAVKLLNSLKGLDEKDIVNALVNKIKANETVTKVDTEDK